MKNQQKAHRVQWAVERAHWIANLHEVSFSDEKKLNLNSRDGVQ